MNIQMLIAIAVTVVAGVLFYRFAKSRGMKTGRERRGASLDRFIKSKETDGYDPRLGDAANLVKTIFTKKKAEDMQVLLVRYRSSHNHTAQGDKHDS